jgi:4-nitrophenol 2-monooxygenase / 4-nitrocatechol 4-monooxygenase, reductase component
MDRSSQREVVQMTPCDSAVFRRTIGHFASGVAVITTSHGTHEFGMTASAVTSLSLEPPMLVVCINRKAPTHGAIRSSDRFAVNVLARPQEQLARHFATPSDDKFAGVAVTEGKLGMPLLDGCVANFECEVVSVASGGTHTIFIAEVLTAVAHTRRDPLLYYCGRFGRLRLADDLIEASADGHDWSDWTSEMFRAV